MDRPKWGYSSGKPMNIQMTFYLFASFARSSNTSKSNPTWCRVSFKIPSPEACIRNKYVPHTRISYLENIEQQIAHIYACNVNTQKIKKRKMSESAPIIML